LPLLEVGQTTQLSELYRVRIKSSRFYYCRNFEVKNGVAFDSRLDANERSELLDIFAATARWTRIYFGWRPNLRDEGDNHLVELAVAGGASHIITHNTRDFAAPQLKFNQLKIITPTQFLQEHM
jgi:predicted nucleic acid-binding protein